jgi:hypothetical protein
MPAAQVDNRMRAWYQKDMAVGLLYACALGEVRPDCPVALIQSPGADGGGNGSGGGGGGGAGQPLRVIPCEQQLPQQREQVRLHGPCPKVPIQTAFPYHPLRTAAAAAARAGAGMWLHEELVLGTSAHTALPCTMFRPLVSLYHPRTAAQQYFIHFQVMNGNAP